MLKVEIVAPHEKIFEGEADIVSVPGSKSPFQILQNHAPIVSSLDSGIIEIKSKNETTNFVISSGFIEVLNNKVSILVDYAINVENLIEPEIIAEIKKLEENISKGDEQNIIVEYKKQLKLAKIKLKAIEKK